MAELLLDRENKIHRRMSETFPLLAIRCLAYNHEPYIRQCLEGFVMQKTDFPFIAIVHDDASTDKTADIIREYAEKYPDIIKPIFEKENQYSKHDGSIGRIMNKAIPQSVKYIAPCEGDDYWTNSFKLQKQVSFLEANHDYSICFHNALVHWENGIYKDHLFAQIESREYSGKEIYENWIVPTASVVYRKEALTPKYNERCSNPAVFYKDIILFLSLVEDGWKAYGFEDVMSVYRRHEGGVSYGADMNRLKKKLGHDNFIGTSFEGKYNSISRKISSSTCVYLCYLYLKQRKIKDAITYLNKAFDLSFINAILFLLKSLRHKF